MQLLLVYNASELYQCLARELQRIGIYKKPHLELYSRTWLQIKLWEIHNVPLLERNDHRLFKSTHVLPEYLDSLVFNCITTRVGVPTCHADANYDFETGELFIRYY